MPATHGNNDAWLAQQLKQMKTDIAGLKARTATLASVTTGLFIPARAYRAAAQSTGAGANTQILLDTVSFDPNGYFDVTTNHRFNVPVAGYYWVAGQVQATLPSNDTILVEVWKNGAAATNGGRDTANATGAQGGFTSIADIIECAAGDFLTLIASTGNADALAVGSAGNYLTVMRVA